MCRKIEFVCKFTGFRVIEIENKEVLLCEVRYIA